MGNRLEGVITRIPYATLIATFMCIIGISIFCGTMYRGTTLTGLMLEQVFHIQVSWLRTLRLIFVILGIGMGALGVMILFIGFLATGATRHKVYRAWRARASGRISCAVFMGITYILQLFWIIMLCVLVLITFVFTVFWQLCSNPLVHTENHCIDFTQFPFFFPNNIRPEDMKVCESHEIKLFCRDYVERAELMFILATVACVLILLSLIHYLICLSANYAHIRDHEKFQELQELQYLQDPDIPNSKDRF
ncbi:hypothetical protein M8J75_016643 [Diaphorina citri]|nr:hypothetical protein M8J75_016643 [Diaphorina citri]KAI5734623.1 hypothetical protein M8J77_008848 [Diaphorina citri]